LFSSQQRTENLSIAVGLARCKMSEVEEKLLREGYPAIDQTDEGDCCGDDDEKGFRCSTKCETVQLPQPAAIGDFGLDGGTDPSGLGALGGLASMEQSGGAALSPDAGLSGIAGMLGASAGGGIAPMVMGLVYPDLKPMLEASIRRVTVVVHWTEGKNERELKVTQYVTNPQQGGLDSDGGVMGQISDMLSGVAGGATPGAPAQNPAPAPGKP
jgi:general secretion pathway protein I